MKDLAINELSLPIKQPIFVWVNTPIMHIAIDKSLRVFLLSLVLVLSYSMLVKSQDLVNQARNLQKESLTAFKKMHYEIAESKAYKAADIYLSEGMMQGYIESLLIAVDCHHAKGEKDPARKGYRTIIELCTEYLKKGNKIQPVAMLKLARIYGEEGDHGNAVDLLQKSVLRAEKIIDSDDADLVWAYQYLYTRAEKEGKKAESERFRKKMKKGE